MKKGNEAPGGGRKSLRFFSPDTYDTPPIHLHMFQEDIQQIGFLFGLRRDEEPALRLEGTEQECKKAGALCALQADIPRDWPEENVKSAFRNVVLHLANYGIALFEIVARPEGGGPSLASFNPEYVWNLLFYYLQVAPPASWQRLRRKFAILNKHDMWRIDMPRELGGARGYRRILRELSAWSSLGPQFYSDDLEKGEWPKEFVFGDYRSAHQIQIYKATKNWGWNGRDWSLDYITEYYQFHRHLTFKWAQAVLREHIVREFNSLFRRLRIAAQITLTGLSSPNDILHAREQMRKGVLDFGGATKAIH